MIAIDTRDFCIPSDENDYDELVAFADTIAGIQTHEVIPIGVLDKIRAEIEHVIDNTYDSTDHDKSLYNGAYKDGLYDALDIIDKYMKEQEDWHGKRSSDEKAYKDFCKDYLKHGAESLVKDHPDLVRDIWNCKECEHTEDECKDCYPELGYKNNKLKRDTEAVEEFVKSDTFKELMESLDEQDRAATEDAEQFLRDIKAKEQEE